MIAELQETTDTTELTAEEAQSLRDLGIEVFFDTNQAEEERRVLQEFNM